MQQSKKDYKLALLALLNRFELFFMDMQIKHATNEKQFTIISRNLNSIIKQVKKL